LFTICIEVVKKQAVKANGFGVSNQVVFDKKRVICCDSFNSMSPVRLIGICAKDSRDLFDTCQIPVNIDEDLTVN